MIALEAAVDQFDDHRTHFRFSDSLVDKFSLLFFIYFLLISGQFFYLK